MIKLMRRIALSSLFVATAFTGVQAQQGLSIEQVKDGLYVIIGSGGNVGVRVTSEGVILIDDKFPQNFADIQALVATVSGADPDVHIYVDIKIQVEMPGRRLHPPDFPFCVEGWAAALSPQPWRAHLKSEHYSRRIQHMPGHHPVDRKASVPRKWSKEMPSCSRS